ncbi:MAG TPA: L-histidine N(alpha)-methyltransferase [Gemmatimonadaceae bacterium]|nr:L-histidine N(alpha)-methyltransferase [Gemmatimonadaceae bacterium]
MTSLFALPLPPPRESALLRDVRLGLTRRQKELPSKYFYDHRGSLLFEAITRLPEYYLTRAERRLLCRWMPPLLEGLAPATLVELGAGSGEKTRIILRAMHEAGRGRHYIPVDVSADFLDQSAARLRGEHSWLDVTPIVADFTESFASPELPAGPALFAFLGSTIGNLEDGAAVALLRRVRRAMRPDDRFLLGADLHTKSIARIERAYDDRAGVTAEFNRNVLRVVNRELGATFEPEAFAHHAPWSWAHHRIEMHLVARHDMRVRVPGLGIVGLRSGESIRTEICGKYDQVALERMLADAGLRIESWCVDEEDQYAILVAAPCGALPPA